MIDFALDWLVCEDRPFLFIPGKKKKIRNTKKPYPLFFFSSWGMQISLDT